MSLIRGGGENNWRGGEWFGGGGAEEPSRTTFPNHNRVCMAT